MQLEPDKVVGVDLFAIQDGFLAQTDLRTKLGQAAEKAENFTIDIGEGAQAAIPGAFSLKGRIIPSDGVMSGHILLQFVKER